MIERKEYLDALKRWRDKRVIKVITGIRRCGKSTLMELFQEELRSSGVTAEQIISINLEDFDCIELRDPVKLHSAIVERASPTGKTYVFLDEIQNVRDFPPMIDSLFLRKNLDLYMTGSNAYMLSGELATHLSGRYVTIDMLPLSFAEYVQWTGNTYDLGRKYREYIETSSFPYVTELDNNRKAIEEYLSGIYHTVVLKDVVGRLKKADPMILESILRFVYSSIGSPISTKKIADTLTSEGRKLDVRTVERYLSAFLDSYIVYQVKRYDIRGKQHLKTLEKYYAVDIGLRFFMLGHQQADIGHLLENVIYLELLRRGYDVFIGKMDEFEIDFVAVDQSGTTYIQVAASVRDEATLRRELRPLQRIDNHYPKMILTLDDDPAADYEGIRRINALEWLLDKH
ncbi:MAG: ATP-binding protein [Clostridia bacterium]|nr:ATP-binding protein [Clostridia bacterium]